MVRHYVRKRFFHTRDRVLVHLSSESLRSEEQTQEGIAAAVKSGRSTLTKWLDRMEEEGLVQRDRVRLRSHPLPKYIYRLTDEGWRRAGQFRSNLATRVVTVRAPDLEPLSVRLSEVPRLAPDRMDLTTAVASVRKGRLEIARDRRRPTRDAVPRVWGPSLQRVDRFFGREEELRALDAWFATGSRALFMTGLAGIGKSALVATWARDRSLRGPVYGFEIHPSTAANELLTDFAAFLAGHGKPSLATHLAQGVPMNPGFVLRLLERDLAGLRLLVVMDNADQASREVARIAQELLFQMNPKMPTRTVFVCRRIPKWVKRSSRKTPPFDVRRIQGLDTEGSQALLRYRGLEPKTRAARNLIRRTRGHPLLLHLAAATGTEPEAVIEPYLAGEVWRSLSAKDRLVLETASVFRKPVTERALAESARTDPRGLASLASRNLLERTIGGGYVLHDLVRDFVYGRLPPSRRKRLDALAAAALLRSTDSRERWEGVYHLLAAGKVPEAARILDSEGAPLLDCVAAEEIASLAGSFALDETDAASYCVFAEVLGDSLRIRGHVKPAITQYGHALRVAEASGATMRAPRLLRKMATLERWRNHYSRALGYLVEAKARLQGTKDLPETTEVLREMALVEQALGDLGGAASHLDEAIDFATEMSDRAALCRTLLALGSLQSRRGHPDRGLETNLEGMRVAERSGNLTEIAHAHIVLGTTLAERGQYEEALHEYSEGDKIARILGNLRLTAYAALNQAAALIELRRFEEAGHVMSEAEGYLGILEERDALALLKTYEGQRQMGLGHWHRAKAAWEEGLSALRALGSPADLAAALKQVGEFYLQHGDTEEGRARLVEARNLSRKTGNVALLEETSGLLARLAGAPNPVPPT